MPPRAAQPSSGAPSEREAARPGWSCSPAAEAPAPPPVPLCPGRRDARSFGRHPANRSEGPRRKARGHAETLGCHELLAPGTLTVGAKLGSFPRGTRRAPASSPGRGLLRARPLRGCPRGSQPPGGRESREAVYPSPGCTPGGGTWASPVQLCRFPPGAAALCWWGASGAPGSVAGAGWSDPERPAGGAVGPHALQVNGWSFRSLGNEFHSRVTLGQSRRRSRVTAWHPCKDGNVAGESFGGLDLVPAPGDHCLLLGATRPGLPILLQSQVLGQVGAGRGLLPEEGRLPHCPSLPVGLRPSPFACSLDGRSCPWVASGRRVKSLWTSGKRPTARADGLARPSPGVGPRTHPWAYSKGAPHFHPCVLPLFSSRG